jgi:hypothetical protein
MTRKTILPLILFLSLGALAQNHTAMPGMTAHPNPSIIDGSQHPELIPDAVAQRLYFETVAALPSDVQRAQLASAGLNEQEIATAEGAIGLFKAQWDALRNSYNNPVQSGQPYDRQAFSARRDALVTELLSQLQLALTQQAFANLTAHVKAEKKMMKLAVKGGK